MSINPYENLIQPDGKPLKEEYKVNPLLTSEAVRLFDDLMQQKQNRKKDRKFLHEENINHFRELTQALEKVHRIFVEKKIPYRFCIYMEKDEIMIDIMKLSASGASHEIIRKNITHEDFFKWIQNIENADGMVIDNMG